MIELITHKIVLVITFILGVSQLSTAQDVAPSQDYNRWKIGFSYGYAFNKIADWGPDYDYKVQLFELQARYTIKEARKHEWAIVISPQYNLTRLVKEDSDIKENAYEFGVNAGISYLHKITGPVSFYANLSAGPHYISKSLNRQVPGFIFSDNLELGLQVELNNSWWIYPNFGYRHISNASLNSPNNGINNFIVACAILKTFETKRDE